MSLSGENRDRYIQLLLRGLYTPWTLPVGSSEQALQGLIDSLAVNTSILPKLTITCPRMSLKQCCSLFLLCYLRGTAAQQCVQPLNGCHTPFPGHSLLQYLPGYTLQLHVYTMLSGNPPHPFLLRHSSLPGLLLLQSSGNSGPPGRVFDSQCSQTFKERGLQS